MSRVLPRFTDTVIEHDPLEIKLAQMEAQRDQAIEAITNGTHLSPDATELRGIPVQARGVGGTSPGSDPYRETERRLMKRAS